MKELKNHFIHPKQSMTDATLSKEARDRIIREIRMVQKHPLTSEGIWVLPDETDLRIVRACIQGPEGTPYENGFYLFRLEFPENYPYSPPKATYFTTDGGSRMHPNYYCSGKVCVSIIGTWSGPGWTSCQNLSSVLLTFRSLLIENPLWQEPGFENKVNEQNTDYNELIRYENMRVGILRSFHHTPVEFEGFQDLMRAYLIQYRERIMEQAITGETIAVSRAVIKDKIKETTMHPIENAVVSSPQIYNFQKVIHYKKIQEKLNTLYMELLPPRNAHLLPELRALMESVAEEGKLMYKDVLKLTREFTDEYGENINYLLALLEIEGHVTRDVRGCVVIT